MRTAPVLKGSSASPKASTSPVGQIATVCPCFSNATASSIETCTKPQRSAYFFKKGKLNTNGCTSRRADERIIPNRNTSR